VLEQVAQAGSTEEAVAKSVVRWAGQARVQVRGGRGIYDRSLTMYADSGRGKGVLCLYAAQNGNHPMLELRLEQWRSMPPYDSDSGIARLAADLFALGLPRLEGENLRTAIRPSVPLSELAGGRLGGVLSLADKILA
jgi:hypothetical protein